MPKWGQTTKFIFKYVYVDFEIILAPKNNRKQNTDLSYKNKDHVMLFLVMVKN